MEKPVPDLAAMRMEYLLRGLLESEAGDDPIALFQTWLAAALRSGMLEPNAMTLATVDAEGRPAARMVLLKGADARGFTFFTNYQSRKGRELSANPHAALCFWWDAMERQVRIEGRVERVSAAESDEYFASRPRGSQLGAHASEQSAELPDRGLLTAQLAELERRFAQSPIPRPEHWGGFRVVPDAIEFWQGRASRLHDRLRFTKNADGGWRRVRLSP